MICACCQHESDGSTCPNCGESSWLDGALAKAKAPDAGNKKSKRGAKAKAPDAASSDATLEDAAADINPTEETKED